MEKEKQIQKEKQTPRENIESEEMLIRISGYDIPGSKNVYVGLTKVKGVSWGISNFTCVNLKIPRNKKISELSKEEIAKIEQFFKEANITNFLKNRIFGFEDGETKHYIGSNLDIKKDFDIRRLRKIRSYKGVRHSSGLPVRGQRTRSHFRKRGKAVGVKRSK